MNAIQDRPDIDIRYLVSDQTLSPQDRANLYRKNAAEQRGLPQDATWGEIAKHDLKGSGIRELVRDIQNRIVLFNKED